MRAVIATSPGEVAVAEVPEPEGTEKALVAVAEAGICGTDIKVASGSVPITYPRILGHEIVGTVVAAPGGGVPKGSRVLLDPFASCGWCRQCLADRPNLCSRGALLGRDADGGFAELVAVHERQIHPLPDHIPDSEAVVVQVLATCVHAQSLVQVFPGEVAVIVGLGVTGLLHLQLLRARGLDRIVGITRSTRKRNLAMELGATAVADPKDAGVAVDRATDGRGASLIVESVGEVGTLAQAIELAEPGGTVLVFGIITAAQGSLPFYDLYYKELNVVGARGARPRDYERAIELAASGTVLLAPLLSDTRPIDSAPQLLTGGLGRDVLKLTLRIGP